MVDRKTTKSDRIGIHTHHKLSPNRPAVQAESSAAFDTP